MAVIIDFKKTRESVKKNLPLRWERDTQRNGETYTPIDLTIPLTDGNQRRKVNDIFLWMSGTILRQDLDIKNLDKADGRRADLERLLDVCFGEDQNMISEESREVIRSAYYDAWKTIWKNKEKNPAVKPFLKMARASDAPVLKFIAENELNGMKPEAFIKAENGRIWECDCSYNGLKRRNDLAGKGILIVADSDRGEFFPIYTLKSLSALVASKLVWTEEKLVKALKRSRLTSPVLIKFDADNAMIFYKQM